MSVTESQSPVGMLRGFAELFRTTTTQEIKTNICQTVKKIFEDAMNDPALTEELKGHFSKTMKTMLDKIMEEETNKAADAGAPNTDSDNPTTAGGSRKKNPKKPRHNHTRHNHKNAINKSKKYTKNNNPATRHPTSRGAKVRKGKVRSSTILTSVERECTCSNPDKCECVESRETFKDQTPPSITMSGGNADGACPATCEGAV
jgi:hypothetical protein